MAKEGVETWRDLLFDEMAHDDGLDDLLERILHLRFHWVALGQLQLPWLERHAASKLDLERALRG